MADTDDREWLDALAGQMSDGRRVPGTASDGADPPVDASALEGNPFEGKSTWRTAVRATGTRGWAAAALAVAALAVGMHLAPNTTDPAHMARVSPDGIVRLADPDPHALRQQLVDELRAVNVQVSGYAQLGIEGVDADLPLPVPESVQRVLIAHHIPAPANGALRIEISRKQ